MVARAGGARGLDGAVPCEWVARDSKAPEETLQGRRVFLRSNCIRKCYKYVNAAYCRLFGR